MSAPVPAHTDTAAAPEEIDVVQAGRVLANPKFLALFLSQVFTQVGGNMVLFALTVQVYSLTRSSTSVSILLLTFLVPAVIFGAVAGVYVDRFDRRMMLVGTNLLRALAFLVLVFFDENLLVLYALTIVVATLTTFFAPAEAAMIPIVVDRRQLITANGVFIFALQASFVAGFAILGPLFSNLLGTQILILVVAALYGLAAAMCSILPRSDPRAAPNRPGEAIDEAERAVAATFSQLREGLSYIRDNRGIFWSLSYLAITASLVGVMGVLGPDFAVRVLGLSEDGFVIVILPLGVGLVLGILALNVYGKYFPRQRLIEGGLIALGASLVVLALAQRIGGPFLTGPIVSLLTVVVVVAFAAGVSYAFVAVPAQTQLQEELPSEVRGRVFGVLNMLVSLASLGPIVVVGPLADVVGTPAVLATSAGLVIVAGVVSILKARPSANVVHHHQALAEPVDPMTVTTTAPLTRPVKLHYLDAGDSASTPVASPASPLSTGPPSEGSNGRSS
ncbi:MAG: MFS transporter [Chloroflexi bacterium]|nr:MFS transporter [Chloroflexota bacterium]MDQ3407984.1 MFS transporter [Chloroflexota bacterium]